MRGGPPIHPAPRLLIEGVAERFGLGRVRHEPVAIAGGLLNRIWKIQTTTGEFAVKELNLERDWPTPFDAVHRLELAAISAGVRAPAPVPDPASGEAVATLDDYGASVLVHTWVNGDRVEEVEVTGHFAALVGRSLAAIHQLDVPWPDSGPGRPLPTADDWQSLAAAAHRSAVPWSPELAAGLDALVTASDLIMDWSSRDDAVVVSHRDVGPKNLLAEWGKPVLLDWEAAGPTTVAAELGHSALGLAGNRAEPPDPAVFRALLAGYADGGGQLPEPGPHWFTKALSNWAHFLRWNIERALSPDMVSGGPPLEVTRRVIDRGLLEIPAILDRLPALSDLTVT